MAPPPPPSSPSPSSHYCHAIAGGGGPPRPPPPAALAMNLYTQLPLSWCNFSPTQRHEYRPHARMLYRASCMYCGITNDCQRAREHPTYLRYRRRFQQDAGLLSIGVPLDEASTRTLQNVAEACGITTTSSLVPMLTLVEGLVPAEAETETPRLYVELVKDVQRALSLDSKLTVRKVHKVRQKDDAFDLIVVNVDVAPRVGETIGQWADAPACVLPQFTLHLNLGCVLRKFKQSADAVKKVRHHLLGFTSCGLAVDGQGVQVLSAQGHALASSVDKPTRIPTRGLTTTTTSRSVDTPPKIRQPPREASSPTPASPALSSLSSLDSEEEEPDRRMFSNKRWVAPFCEEVASHATTALTEDCSVTVGTMEDGEGLDYDLSTTPLAIDLSFLEIHA